MEQQKRKYIAIIEGVEYKVGYPVCRGCENLCFPAPLACCYNGDGCKYPEHRKVAEQGNDDPGHMDKLI